MKKALFILCVALFSITETFGQSGWLDPSFGNSGIVTTTYPGSTTAAEKVVIQNDGKIVVLGTYNSGSYNHIMISRYLPDGSLDATFGTGGITTTILATEDIPKDIIIQTDGKLVVLTQVVLARYTSAGALDLTFDTDGWLQLPANYSGFSLGLQSTGRIVVGAKYYFNDGFSTTILKGAVLIYNTSGSLFSTTLTPSLYSYYSGLEKLHTFVQNDNKVVICGRGDFGGGFVFRTDVFGGPDTLYGAMLNGLEYFPLAPIHFADMQTDGKIVFINYDDNSIYRITTTATLETVGPTSISAFQTNDLKVLADNKLLLCTGLFSSTSDYTLYRLNSDATVDATFSPDGKVAVDLTGSSSEAAKSIAVQADGKYILTGTASDNFGTIRISTCTARTATDVVHACSGASYTWIDGLTYTSNNNTATYTLSEGASNGCDSIVTLNLTFGGSGTSTDVIASCGSFTWINGSTYNASNNTANYTFTGGSASGCDSTVNLDLTITSLVDHSLAPNNGFLVCSGSDTITLTGSTAGVDYYLRNNSNDSIVAGPLAGTGGDIEFGTGIINSNTSYNVLAQGYRPSYAYDFNGVDQHIELPDMSANLNLNTITTEAWINIDNYGAVGQLVPVLCGILGGPGVTFSMHYSNSGTTTNMFAGFYDGTWHLVSYPAPPLGQWVHIAATYDRANIKLYYNGVEVASVAETAALPLYSQGWRIARRWDNPDYFDGKIDNIRIWNTARSAQEIADNIMNCDIGGTDLVASYNFDDAAYATFVNDFTGLHNGTPVNLDLAFDKTQGVKCATCTLEMATIATVQVIPLQDYVLSATSSTICYNDSTTINVSSSHTGANYYLRDITTDTIVSGPVSGTDNTITIPTGPMTNSQTFNVYVTMVSGTEGALSFDGLNDYVAIPDNTLLSFDQNDSFTIEGRVKWLNGNRVLFAKMDNADPYVGYDVIIPSNGSISFQLIHDWFIGNAIEVTTIGTPLADNQYHAVSVVYGGGANANNVKIYVDGIAQALAISHNNLAGSTMNSVDATIGARNGGLNWTGDMSWIRVWNVALSSAQVKQNLIDCPTGSEMGLVALYNLEEGAGSVVTDATMNGLHGTMINMVPSSDWVDAPSSCPTCELTLTQTATVNVLSAVVGTDVQTACNTFTWMDGNTYTSSNNTATHIIAGGAVTGCDSTVTLNLTINSVSDLTTTLNGETITANNTTASYQWLYCDSNYVVVAGESGQSYTPMNNGNFAVQLTENGCVDTSACVAVTTIGITENNFSNSLKVFPNPTTGEFSVDLGMDYENVEISISDVTGKILKSASFNTARILNLSVDTASGLYFVKITSKDKSIIVKLIKE